MPRKLSLLVVATLLSLLVSGLLLGRQAGYRLFVVTTGSMRPALPPATLLLVAPAAQLRVGDVITFHPGPTATTTHRVVSVDASGVRTKGDANPSADYWRLTPDQIVGKVVGALPYAGYAVVYVRQPGGVASLLLVGLAVWLAWGLFFPSTATETARAGAPSGRRRRRTPVGAGQQAAG